MKASMQTFFYAFHTLPAPFNRVLLITTQTELVALLLADTNKDDLELIASAHKRFGFTQITESEKKTKWCAQMLAEQQIPPFLLFGTPFQKRVWHALQTIPMGTTTTYQKLADAIEHPKAVRAVANAVGTNPISILIPCHRVVRTDGSLGGFYWGVNVKKRLLKDETPA